MSAVWYELGFYNPEDGILHNHCRVWLQNRPGSSGQDIFWPLTGIDSGSSLESSLYTRSFAEMPYSWSSVSFDPAISPDALTVCENTQLSAAEECSWLGPSRPAGQQTTHREIAGYL
jgi:hypothetical protein